MARNPTNRRTARADLTPGALYSIDGGDGYLYYGQIAGNMQVAFFRFRSNPVAADTAIASAVMSRFGVSLPSIGRALRAGRWIALGRFPLRAELSEDPVLVQWPVGTSTVTLWRGSQEIGTALVADPKIQHLEVMAAHDAIAHVPERLRADFEERSDAWRAGGSVRRHRLLKEDRARRFPEQPWHKLPVDWVPVQ